MAQAKFYLDTRATKPGAPAPLKIRIPHNGGAIMINLGVKLLPEQWDEVGATIVGHPQKRMLNDFIKSKMAQITGRLLEMRLSGELSALNGKALKSRLERNNEEVPKATENHPTFLTKFQSFAETRNSEGTKSSYRQTLARMRAFDNELHLRKFEDIDKDYLMRFDAFLAKTNRRNSRNVYYRNIRAVFNDAIDDEITTCYPFRKFKLKSEPTRKRSLSVEELRILKDYPVEDYQERYRDMFMLMFYLIGINAVDLLKAPKDSVRHGRLDYARAKTHKPYSIKIEPEAQELIDKYAGKEYLLNPLDTCTDYKNFLHHMGDALKEIGEIKRVGRGGKKVRTPLFPDLSQYWCRHTWATLASKLDIPKETIAAALGHGKLSTTDIYINFDENKIDIANRMVIDFLFGKCKPKDSAE